VIDDCLQYVALAGYVHDASLDVGLCKDFWLNKRRCRRRRAARARRRRALSCRVERRQ